MRTTGPAEAIDEAVRRPQISWMLTRAPDQPVSIAVWSDFV
jgi:hypothetical protein